MEPNSRDRPLTTTWWSPAISASRGSNGAVVDNQLGRSPLIRIAFIRSFVGRPDAVRSVSFDNASGAGKQRRRHVKTERLCGLEINDQIKFGWRLHGEVGRLGTFQNAVDVTAA